MDPLSSLKLKIDSQFSSVIRLLSDKFALEEARDLVPISELVQENIHVLEGDYKTNLLPIITNWFATQFFTWFNPPDCDRCHDELVAVKCCTNEEGKVVESYKCANQECICGTSFDFIRHKDPAILLRTRTGRCGEWADCFLVFLNALDYDARLVLDTTDHVWNEVWSEAQGRWLHVDPCENTVDSPLLYEIGWSKKLEYCIAASKYEVLDVTPRYVVDFEKTKQRRYAGSEFLLDQYFEFLTQEKIKSLPPEKRDEVMRRRKVDIQYLRDLSPEKRHIPSLTELGGRKTGSIQWRIQRGEYSPTVNNKFVIRMEISEHNDKCQLFYIRYNSLQDRYESSCEKLSGSKKWSSLIYMSENIEYKYERDWKTSYLSRFESCPPERAGKIQWNFDLSGLNHSSWNRLEIRIGCQNYPNTEVDLRLETYTDDEESKPIKEQTIGPNKLNSFQRSELGFSDGTTPKTIHLIAIITGGDPDDVVAWQKPQLFRSTRNSTSENNEWPFEVRLCK